MPASQPIETASRLADQTIDTLKETPAALGRAAAQVQDFTRRGVERARELGCDVRDRATRAGDRTVGYIQDEPVKAVLIAAAVGAVTALLVRMLSSGRHHH